MIKIFGLSGSLRAASFNAGLLRAAAELAPDGTELLVGTIKGVPLYDGDAEAATGIPSEVQRLKDQLAAADAMLLVTPEYNNGMPGVFKNAIDWMTRPANDIPGLFGGKPSRSSAPRPVASEPSLRRITGCPCCARSAPSRGSGAGC